MAENGREAPERRHVTVAFADIVGSTALSRTLSPDFYFELIERVRAIVRRIADRHGGIVSHQEGDASLLIFGYPVANGHDAPSALRAALDIQAAIEVADFSDIDLPNLIVERLL